MSKAGNGATHQSVERQFKEMADRGTLEMALVSDDRGFCWNAVGNHFDPGVLAALPSVLGDSIRNGRLKIRYFAQGKAGFDVDGADVKALLEEAGLTMNAPAEEGTGFPMWQLTVGSAGAEGSLEYSLIANQGRTVIRPLDSKTCNLFLVGVYSSHPREKGATQTDAGALSNEVERILNLIGTSSAKGDSPKSEQVAAILNGLREADPQIRSAALHLADGLVVASVSASDTEADSLAAIASGIFHSCQLVGMDMLGGIPEQLCFQGDAGILMGMAVREDVLLSVMLEPGAGLGLVDTLLRQAVGKFAEVIAPATKMAA